MRRPVIGVTLAFVAGTACGLETDAPVGTTLGAAVLLLIIAAVRLVWALRHPMEAARGAVVNTCLLLAGTLLVAWAAASPGVRGRQPVPESWRQGGSPAAVQAEVVGDPEYYPGRQAGQRRYSTPLRLLATQAVPDGPWEQADFTCVVWWTVFGSQQPPRYGERWRLEGVQWPARDLWFPELNRRARVYGRQASRLSRDHGNPFFSWCYRARRQLSAHLARGVEDFPEEASIQQAMMVGSRGLLSREAHDLGVSTGTLHIFAISGQHVAILVGLCVLGLRACGLSREWWFWALAPLVIGYTVLTGAPASAVRSCVMALVFLAAPSLGRRSDAACALAFSAVAILAFSPMQLRDIGFVYSYVVVLALIVWFPLVSAWSHQLVAPDPLRVQPLSRPSRLARAVVRELAALAGLSVVAWFASLPVTAFYFERVTPVALVANLAVVPLAFLMVFCGCLSVLFGSVIGLLGELYNYAGVGLIRLFLIFTRALADVPGAHLVVPRPALWQIALYVVAMSAVSAWAWRVYGARLPAEPLEQTAKLAGNGITGRL